MEIIGTIGMSVMLGALLAGMVIALIQDLSVRRARRVGRRAPAPQLNPKWDTSGRRLTGKPVVCQHPDDQLLDIRSDAFTKGGLVATLCQACDEQLGPEVYQAYMDRKFADWQHEIATKEEREAERKRIADDLRAEQKSLRALDTRTLQHFLEDASDTLAKMRWGVNASQDARRAELSANCKKWRGELERRGVKEIPSWKQNLTDRLLPHKKEFLAGGAITADQIYVPVMPDLRGIDFAQEVLRPQVEAIEIRAHGKVDPIRTVEETYKEHWGRSDWLLSGWNQPKRSQTVEDHPDVYVEMHHPALGSRMLHFHDIDKFWNWASR